jgi:hypothetical protein
MSVHECIICSDVITAGYTGIFDTKVPAHYFPIGNDRVRRRRPDGYAHHDCWRSKEVRLERACVQCGWKRKVKVTRSPILQDGNVEQVERWQPTCTACDHGARVAELLIQARRHSALRAAIIAKRGVK